MNWIWSFHQLPEMAELEVSKRKQAWRYASKKVLNLKPFKIGMLLVALFLGIGCYMGRSSILLCCITTFFTGSIGILAYYQLVLNYSRNFLEEYIEKKRLKLKVGRTLY